MGPIGGVSNADADFSIRDVVQARTLDMPRGVTGGPTSLTVTNCAQSCLADSYKYFGVEYGDECCM